MITNLNNKAFVLHTAHTTYCFRVMDTGHLEHLYYGKRIRISDLSDLDALTEKHRFAPGNTILYNQNNPSFSLEDIRLEMSSFGKGDIREPFLEILHSNGSLTSDFLYDHAHITEGKETFSDLPSSYGTESEVEQLCITLRDTENALTLELYYYIYEDCDVICRSTRLINNSTSEIRIKRLMSTQLDLDTSDYEITTFHGGWAKEMAKHTLSLTAGKFVSSSSTGSSSSRSNPFVMFGKRGTAEESGECYGMNLIYSGNHYEAFDVNSFGKMRFVSGINPEGFSYLLNAGESFQAPEAVMTFSSQGYQQMSHNLHHFVRHHIVRGEWKEKPRPVLLNSWEACYFHVNERKLLKLASQAKKAGAELFVLDDGWFGERNDDTSSLGDWEPNRGKLPGGLKQLGDKIVSMGLSFGIWVEPEMVNTNSNLYRSHPDWALEIPNAPHSEGRNQRILDLTQTEVQDFVIDKMSEVFGSAPISYVKWDMNRIFSDVYSQHLPSDRQQEVAHRYILGLYRCMKELTERFPHILFEGCAAGGNRFDLGILCYFPQIWASDNTDALCRAEMQTNYSYGYPLSTVSAHISACPNHQTLRTTPLETRFNVASFGLLGYEFNFGELKSDELQKVKDQIEWYKTHRETLQFGTFYRGRSFSEMNTGSVLTTSNDNITEWTCVSPDRTEAVGMILQKLVKPNHQYLCYYPKGLNPSERYHFYNLPMKHKITEFGSLVNAVSPVHIKDGSLVHHIASAVIKMDGESEDYTAYGETFMNAGVRLSQAFSSSGYDDSVRHFPDFASRLYIMEKLS